MPGAGAVGGESVSGPVTVFGAGVAQGFSGLLVLRPPQRSVIGVSDGRKAGYVSGPNEGAERCFPDVVIGVSDGRKAGYVSGPNEGAERSGGVFRMSVAAPRPAGSPGPKIRAESGPLFRASPGRRVRAATFASGPRVKGTPAAIWKPRSTNLGESPECRPTQPDARTTHHVRAALLSVRRSLHCRRRSARGPGGSPSRSPTPAPARRWGRSG